MGTKMTIFVPYLKRIWSKKLEYRAPGVKRVAEGQQQNALKRNQGEARGRILRSLQRSLQGRYSPGIVKRGKDWKPKGGKRRLGGGGGRGLWSS